MANAPSENPEQVPSGSQQQMAPEDDVPVPTEAKMPTRKDVSLKEFLNKMDDYAPIVSASPFDAVPTRRPLHWSAL